MKLKRLESRGLCADLIKMTWTPELEFPRTNWVILGDISHSGACLEAEEPIPVNTVVDLEFGEDRCKAVVQYCKYDKVKYLLGVEFEVGYRWSPNHWKPEHLIQFSPPGTDKPC